jgi:signal transduction histidine kinase
MIYLEFFTFGMLFIILLFCVLLYFNKVIEREYVYFGVLIAWFLLFYCVDSTVFFLNNHVKTYSINKISFFILTFFPIFLVLFIFNVIKHPIPKPIKYLNLSLIFAAVICTTIPIGFDIFKIIWKLVLFFYIIVCFKFTLKIYKSENMPELINALAGFVFLEIFTVGIIAEKISLKTYKYAIFIFIIFVINGLTRRFARINNELKNFPSKLLTERDNERKRLGKELHDGLGQLLIAIKLTLQIHSRVNKDIFSGLVKEISTAIKELKNICENLKPSVLDKLGLTQAIQYSLDKYGKKFNVNFENNLKKEDIIPPVVKENIYRIFQECLNNVIKHSEASKLEVTLKLYNNSIIFNFKDNGRGFDKREEKSGIGLLSIQERVASLNGDLDIISGLSNGVEINVKIPLKENING